VKHNTTTIKRLLSTLINWTHFPTFLGAPVSDQDRTAQVASFCTAAPNICQSAVPNIVHTTLLAPDVLRRLPDFLKIYKPLVCHPAPYTQIYTAKQITQKYRLLLRTHMDIRLS